MNHDDIIYDKELSMKEKLMQVCLKRIHFHEKCFEESGYNTFQDGYHCGHMDAYNSIIELIEEKPNE